MPIFKVMLLMKRRSGMSFDEFVERYERVHVPLAERHATPKLVRYERHYLRPSPVDFYGEPQGEPEYDVATELWYESREAFEALQRNVRDHPERLAGIVADEEALFDRGRARLVLLEDRESELPGRDRAFGVAPALQRLIDKDAIQDLVHRYSYFVDHRMPDEVVALFVDDCRVDYGPAFGPPLIGRGALRGVFGGDGDPGEEGAPRGFLALSHHNANVLIDFEGEDRARVATSLYAWHEMPGGGTPRVWGYYRDVVVRTDIGWRFAERELRLAGSEDWPFGGHPLSGPVRPETVDG